MFFAMHGLRALVQLGDRTLPSAGSDRIGPDLRAGRYKEADSKGKGPILAGQLRDLTLPRILSWPDLCRR